MKSPRQRLRDARLYLLATRELCRDSLTDTVVAAVEGGVDVLQFREKHLGDGEFLREISPLLSSSRSAGAISLVNDRVAVAQLCPCDGVHLGQEDLPLLSARSLLGDDALIGISTHNREQAREAELGGADYIGVGPTFPTGTKDTGYAPLLPERVAEIAAAVSIPAFAIGGITVENLPLLIEAGVRRVAVSSAILSAEHPQEVVREMKAILTPSGSGSR